MSKELNIGPIQFTDSDNYRKFQIHASYPGVDVETHENNGTCWISLITKEGEVTVFLNPKQYTKLLRGMLAIAQREGPVLAGESLDDTERATVNRLDSLLTKG